MIRRWMPYLFIFLACSMLACQGLCMTDDGFMLTAYQQIFEHPESVSYLFLYYWTAVLGGAWQLLFGHLGIFGFRLLECLVIVATIAAVHALLRPAMKHSTVWGGIALVCLFLPDVGVFHYNSLSALVLMLCLLLLHRALMAGSWRPISCAGFVLGISFFVRLPNVSLSVLILLLLPYYCYTRDRRRTWLLAAAALGGTALGIVFTLAVMAVAGHVGCFAQGLQAGFSLVESGNESHSWLKLLRMAMHHAKLMAGQLLLLSAAPLLLYGCARVRLSAVRRVLAAVLVVAYGAACWHLLSAIHAVNMLVVAGCAAVAVMNCRRREVVYAALMAAIVAVFMPLGSDFGLLNVQPSNLWPGGAFAVAALMAVFRHRGARFVLPQMGVAVFLMVMAGKALTDFRGPMFYEEDRRTAMTASVERPLANVLTTPRHAREARIIIDAINHCAPADVPLLVYPYAPMLNYLTCRRPCMGNPWPWLYADGTFEHLLQAESTSGRLPVVVRMKSPLNKWTEKDDEWDDTTAPETYGHRNLQIRAMQQFLHKNGYRVVWEDDYFQLLRPSF